VSWCARAGKPELRRWRELVCSGWKARATEVVWVGVLGLESPSYGSGVSWCARAGKPELRKWCEIV